MKNLFKRTEKLIVTCQCGHSFNYLSLPESGMGYVKCPKCGKPITEKGFQPTEKYIISDPKEALDKLLELSRANKNFKIDIQPFPGIKFEGNNFLIIKENETWFLRIC